MIYYLGEINNQLLYLYFNMQARRNWYNILKSWGEKKILSIYHYISSKYTLQE